MKTWNFIDSMIAEGNQIGKFYYQRRWFGRKIFLIFYLM